MKKKLLFGFMAVMLVAGTILVGCVKPAPTPGEPIKLTWVTGYKVGFTSVDVATWMMDEIERRSDGQVTFERYYAGSLLAVTDTTAGVGSGAADFATSSWSYSPDRLPLNQIEVVPSLTVDPWVHSKALDEIIKSEPVLQEEIAKQNLHMFCQNAVAPCEFALPEPITTVKELEGLKIRGQSTISAICKAMGMIPVTLPAPEIYDAIAKGTLDGGSNFPIDFAYAVKLWEVAPYWVRNPMGCFGTQTQEMNLDTYNNLPKDIRELFDEVGEEAIDKYVELLIANSQRMIDEFAAGGGHMIELSAADWEKWREVGKPAAAQWWYDLLAGKGLEAEGKRIMKRYEGMIDKYEGGGESPWVDYWDYFKEKYPDKVITAE